VDERIRDLERRAAADPSDDEARLALAVSLVRSGAVEKASEAVDPASAAGYRLLVERAAREPSLLPLLDRAPEWRSSGGDAGCSRWSKAAPVTRPRTIWRRRIEGVHAALGVAVDRGVAYVVTRGPRGNELVALAVLGGETLWRHDLAPGPPAAPLAREGRVYASAIGSVTIVIDVLTAQGDRVWHESLPVEDAAIPGAINATADSLVLPLTTTWRGSSRVPDGRLRACVLWFDLRRGAPRGPAPWEQVFAETAVLGEDWFYATDFVTGPGTVIREGPGMRPDRLATVCTIDGAPQFLALAQGRLAMAVAGTLRVRAADEWSSIGGNITSLALDERRVLVGRGAEFSVRDARTGETLSSWSTHESPLPYRPRGVAHAPPAPRSAVCAGDLCYTASPLSPSLSAFDVRTGQPVWRHEIDGILIPEEGPRYTWPVAEVGPPDRGPLYLAPLPGLIFGITLSGYAFLVG
jgi:hypothetical protein